MKARRGGFAIGLIVGLLLGLVLALGVALYVSKVPIPFVNKVPQRTAEQDAQEAEHNKGWDPNAGLGGKPSARAASAAPAAPPAPAASAAPMRPPAAATPPRAATSPPPAPAPAASAKAEAPALTYFAQAGAYTRSDDAEAQRAKLALLGLDAKISERDQSGRTVYRVRLGPFETKAEADEAMQRLQAAGVESSLVRVQKP